MHLTMNRYPVTSVEWGEVTSYDTGKLSVHREELLAYLQSKNLLIDLEITELALVSPGTPTRIVNIFDVFAARARLGKGALDYPGVLGPVQLVGHGVSAALDNFSVVALTGLKSRNSKVLDMSGPGSEVTRYSEMFHLTVQAKPKRSDMTDGEYHSCLNRIGLSVGVFLARAAAAAAPMEVSIYTNKPSPPGLPRVAYVCMITTHQGVKTADQHILYGDNCSGLHPTILHPNEFLDGAVLNPSFGMGIDTYSFQNNPVIQALYDRHGKDVDLVGVIVRVAHISRDERQRSVQMITNLAHHILGVDLAVVTKLGGGIAESDLMTTVESLEQHGIKTSGVIWSIMGDGTIKDSLTTYSAAADAIASAGIYDAWVNLPEQINVIGGAVIGPFSSDPSDKPVPANSSLRILYRDISGAFCQLGSSRVAMVEI